MNFLKALSDKSLSGVAYKNNVVKKAIIVFLSKNEHATIADLCNDLGLSTPKVNNVITELIDEGLVKDYGKLDSTGGRKPNVYGLVIDSGFFLGVDVKKAYVNIGLIDLQRNLVATESFIPFELANNQLAFNELCSLISTFINNAKVESKKILGAGVSLPGRINHETGHSYNYFNYDVKPLRQLLEEKLSLSVYLENDSRAMAYGELFAGVDEVEKNVLFVNISNGMGMGVIINRSLYYGKSGFAGEFGHIPFFNNEIICNCGKRGCLETEVSGWALLRNFKEKLAEGSSSILSGKPIDDIMLNDVINAVIEEDVLAIELLADLSDKLGRGIAFLINILNPELVILGGSLAKTAEYLRLPLKSSLNKYSQSLVNKDTALRLTHLGENAGVMGSCLLIRNNLLGID